MSDVPPSNQPTNTGKTQPKDIGNPDLKRSQHFWDALSGLPKDLSGVDLRPIYALARTGDENLAVNDREDSWEPRPSETLSHKYPGPIGRLGLPSPRNLDRWKLVQSGAIEVRKVELQGYIDVVSKGEGNRDVVAAMNLLYEAAFAQSGIGKADNIFAPKGVTSEDIAASLAALHVIQMALDELKRLAASGIKRQRERLTEELNAFGQLGH